MLVFIRGKSEIQKLEPQLDSPVKYLKGVGPRRAFLLGRLGVATVEDMLYFFPRAYQDRRTVRPIASLREGDFATVAGTIKSLRASRTRRAGELVRILVSDSSGSLVCTFFHQPYLKEQFAAGRELVLTGKVSRYRNLQMVNPEFILVGEADDGSSEFRIVPIYPLTEGLRQPALRRIVKNALQSHLPLVPDMLPAELRELWKVIPLDRALSSIHYPPDPAAIQKARQRLILDEFLLLQLGLVLRRRSAAARPGVPRLDSSPALLDRFLQSLPYRLTRAQDRVLAEIQADLASGRPMNRLLHGDVGSGKTVLALAAMAIVRANGYQCAIMAPTEILASQHHLTATRMLAPLGLKPVLLRAGVAGKLKRESLEEIASGRAGIVVGTQAVIQEKVAFDRLGLAVIDEQHKFGVMERASLKKKGRSPHVLVMTATPIPRTLTLTLYGDLDVSVVDQLPPGRKKVKTYWIGSDKLPRAYDFIRRETGRGRQAFIVYPLVEESEKLRLKAAREMFGHLRESVFRGLRLGLIHGRMSAGEKEETMKRFRDREIDILVSTVVVEIGIDIPNATVMLVENAERFGLAQLHQLRGRVGRSEAQAYCILQGNPRTESGRQRLEAMRDIDDGFLIAQEDLEIRGPGEFFGTRQHGLPELRIGSMVADVRLLEFARRQAEKIIADDPGLSRPRHLPIRERLLKKYRDRLELIEIG